MNLKQWLSREIFSQGAQIFFFIVSKGCECDNFRELAQKVFS
jgi:hypothetical protein